MSNVHENADKTLVIAWVKFQPRTQALADALGGKAYFVSRSRFWTAMLLLPARYLLDCIETLWVLRREQPGLVVVISPPVFAPLIAWAWCRLHGSRMVIDCHTDAFHSRNWGWSRPVHRWLASRVEAMTLHTEAAAAEVSAWTPHALLLPDDLPEYPAVAPVRPGSRLGLAYRVVIAGSLNGEEPVEASIEAARLLPEVEFTFTGDTAAIPRALVDGAPSNVVFSGWLEYPRFLDALATADVVASFSLSPHIMNRAAFEAIGLGRALVLSDFPGLRSRFGNVALFSSNDPRNMADAISEAVADKTRLEGLSAEASRRLRASRDAAISQLQELVAPREATARRRVLIVSEHDYPSHPLLHRNLAALAAGGAQVHLVCTGDASNGPPTSPSGTVRVHRIPLAHRRDSSLRYPVEYAWFFLRAFPTVSWWSIRHRFDVVQVDNTPDFLVFSTVIARLRGARVVLCLFELMPEFTSVRLKLSPKHAVVRLVYALERLAIGWSHDVIAVNDACKDALVARGVDPSKVTVVPNTSTFPEQVLATGERLPVLVTHATLVERYGVHVAIAAFAQLHQAHPTLRMLVLGAGEQLPELKSLASRLGVADRVDFPGFVPWVDAMSRIGRCCVGLVPLIDDGYTKYMVPMKIYDYVTMGLPVVCSRLQAIEDYFAEDSLSYVPPGDTSALAAAIERLLSDPTEAQRQNRAARVAMQPLEWTAVQPRYFAIMGLD